MTDAARRMTRLALAALAVAALGASACSTSRSICSCAQPDAFVTLPADQPASIESLSTEPECSAANAGDGHLIVTRQDTGTCHVTARLTNGDTYTFAVEFRAKDTGCCGTLAFPMDASVPMLVDAGAGGPD